MLDIAVDQDELAAAVSSACGVCYRLTPLGVRSTYPVFKGESDGAPSVFVKVGTVDEWQRTANLLDDIGECGYLPKFVTDARLDYRGHAVFVMDWKDAKVVYPEDMTERQADSFADACERLSDALQGARDFAPVEVGSPSSPECLYEDVVRYSSRHPLAGRLLRGLLDIPAPERTFGPRPLVIVHGDFHSKNFGFCGDEFTSVFDFDKLTQGLACEDLSDAFVERYSCLGLSAAARRRLGVIVRRVVARTSWPRREFVISCNVARLRFAVRRIRKHPDSAWVALDVLRRDRRICGFLSALES